MGRSIVPPRIRVGLLSDQTSINFPRVEGGYYLAGEQGAYTLRRGFTATAPLASATIHYAVQAGAISDKASAEAFAEKIRGDLAVRVDSVFDPAVGLNRVLAGDFATAAPASLLREQLVARGYGKDMLIVRRPSDQTFAMEMAIVDDENERFTIAGQSLLIVPMTSDTITIGTKPYRTAARLFINSRGLLNVINELNLEDYLRGVIPAEMGSKIYDELEALKAQALAARTYAVRNLGQYAAEGYDICPGPACQAYNGFAGEEALTDQAVRETAGRIITYQGKPIDALYTATCGGETSDVGTMFPGRSEPYLKRVRDVELEMTSIIGGADSGILTESQVSARIFAAMAKLPEQPSAWSARDVERAVEGTARLAGLAQQAVAPPASSRRGDVLAYLDRVLSLASHADALMLPEDRQYFFPQTRVSTGAPYAAAAFLIKWGILPAQDVDRIDMSAAMPREELYALLGSWLRKHEVVREIAGKIAKVDGRTITLKADGRNTTYSLPEGIPLYRKLGDRAQEYASLPVMIGDRALLMQDARHVPVALIVTANFDGASFDRTSSFSNWTRSYRSDELVASINKRNPIKQLVALEPLGTDESKRITELRVTAEGGRTFVLKGLPIRWSLNVPDNLFVIERSVDPDGMPRYTFFGKGWGHGVGFCQVGAYGMAFRGWTAERIIKYFYTGVEVEGMLRQ
ncbi:MAG TPA: SpoIID/LytB domain-containing protein [Thermoanaerobaculia bacterium]|nr:SpoIID/LytB domain-containing protein [Thermoanaerobaculia bacterium]